MIPSPDNIFKNVATYQPSELAFLRNLCPVVMMANKKFLNFQDKPAQLGSSVTYETPPSRITTDSLEIQFENLQQNFRTLTVDKSISTGAAVTIEELIFNNADDYMKRFGMSGMLEIGTKVERDVSSLAESIPYRCFGDGIAPIGTFQQLAQAIEDYKDFGAAPGGLKVVVPNTYVPPIVGTGLNQFAPDRNNPLSKNWQIASFDGADFVSSNQLPVHFSGTCGTNHDTLTVVSTNDPTGANITQLTLSGVSTDAFAIKKYDTLTFATTNGFYFLQKVGHELSSQKVQVTATAPADATAGTVVVNISPALVSTPGHNKNIPFNVTAGMKLTVADSHKCGFIIGGDALYVAIPRMPNPVPYPQATSTDPQTGVSIQSYYGTLPFKPVRGYAQQMIWGKDGVPDYWMKLAFPLN